MKRISILGSTGSIGVQTLDVIRLHPDKFEVCALAAGTNTGLLAEQVKEFRPRVVTCSSSQAAMDLQQFIKRNGISAEVLLDAAVSATLPEVDLVVMGLPGSTGLQPTFQALESGKDIALATKEVLVLAGELFMKRAAEKKIKVLPVDSEQSAIFQCLEGHRKVSLKRILLTASGGPFREVPQSNFSKITKSQALNHPRWKMGPKVTIDSATLMNKGLEVIEARWLFDMSASQIDVLIHPQSIIHSMIEFCDGSVLAQLGETDMRIPISYALAHPDRIISGVPNLNLWELGSLTFEQPDYAKFPLLRAAYDALVMGGSASIVLNAADEAAVDLFLNGKLSFDMIPNVVLDALDQAHGSVKMDLEPIMEFHDSVKEQVTSKWSH